MSNPEYFAEPVVEDTKQEILARETYTADSDGNVTSSHFEPCASWEKAPPSSDKVEDWITVDGQPYKNDDLEVVGRKYVPGKGYFPVTRIRQHIRIGRNDPCPCGSGKKYKKCHINDDIYIRKVQPGDL